MDQFRIIVCGNIDFDDYKEVKKKLDDILANYPNPEIVSGHAKGADSLGERYASEKGLALKIFPAEWKKFGKAAGPIRNSMMIEYAQEAKPLVVAFWDGESKGTKDTVTKAKAKGIKTFIYLHEKKK